MPKKISQHIIKLNHVKIFFAIFYLVGLLGFLYPQTQQLFVQLTPFALLLSVLALIFFNENGFTFKSLMLYLVIYILGLAIEAIGVNTGLVFGNYIYGSGLGIKVWHTPLMIGINWLLLVYISSVLSQKYFSNGFFQVLFASTLMLAYDLVLEQVAPKLQMWLWENNEIPLKNYVAWFLIALLFNGLIQIFKLKLRNKLACTIILCQVLFFLGIFLLNK